MPLADERRLTTDDQLSGQYRLVAKLLDAEDTRRRQRQRPDVIFAAPSNVVIALQKETHSIPIVFANVSDPIAQGVVGNRR